MYSQAPVRTQTDSRRGARKPIPTSDTSMHLSSEVRLLHKYVKCDSGVIRDRPAIHGTRNAETVAQRAR